MADAWLRRSRQRSCGRAPANPFLECWRSHVPALLTSPEWIGCADKCPRGDVHESRLIAGMPCWLLALLFLRAALFNQPSCRVRTLEDLLNFRACILVFLDLLRFGSRLDKSTRQYQCPELVQHIPLGQFTSPAFYSNVSPSSGIP
jgi:hypothetical protein